MTPAGLSILRTALAVIQEDARLNRRKLMRDAAIERSGAAVSLDRLIRRVEGEHEEAQVRATTRRVLSLVPASENADGVTVVDAQRIRDEMSYCSCTVPRECPDCRERERLLVAVGYWPEETAAPKAEAAGLVDRADHVGPRS